MSERGRYIVIEGHDGTGKSTQVQRLRQRLGSEGVSMAAFTVEEPDGAMSDTGQQLVPIATALRRIIKDGQLSRDPMTNVLLFNTARRENWLQAIKPALDQGLSVVTARSYISTINYQGYGEGMPIEDIERRVREDVGEDYMRPDLEIILSVADHAVRHQRIAQRGELKSPDTFESRAEDFQERVRLGYERYAELRNIPLVDASGTLEEVEDRIWQHVEPLFTT